MKVLGLIPARGGSKGVPRKNIIDIQGKPLISYSIEAGLGAKQAGLIDELVVSTDDQEIADISIRFGASVPFLRPDYLSNDTAKSVDVMIHAYEFYKDRGRCFDTILLLQPTTPLRTVSDIRSALKLFEEQSVTSLISCYREEYICDLVTYHKRGNLAIALNNGHNKGARRQELEDLYVRNGAIYITTVDQMIRNHRVFDDVPAMYVMPKDRSVNIDCMDDVEMLRWKLSK
ncbi:MAG: acylneuraminate cytidylyltransferase family protein [Spirochaetales bacterium]|nr:acylneuraminate cytidylyltransferase family protein [Spirochaetales bacterium]